MYFKILSWKQKRSFTREKIILCAVMFLNFFCIKPWLELYSTVWSNAIVLKEFWRNNFDKSKESPYMKYDKPRRNNYRFWSYVQGKGLIKHFQASPCLRMNRWCWFYCLVQWSSGPMVQWFSTLEAWRSTKDK